MKKRKTLVNTVLCAMFIAAGILLPLITGNVTETGKMLCPMHIPIIICGAVCGWQWGMAAGFITPLLRGLIFTTPVLYPTGISMAFELAAYGLVIGLMLKSLSGKIDRLASIYISLIVAMVSGRIVLALANFTLYGMFGTPYSWQMLITSAVIQAVPAIVIQFAIIPPIIYAFGRYGGKKR